MLSAHAHFAQYAAHHHHQVASAAVLHAHVRLVSLQHPQLHSGGHSLTQFPQQPHPQQPQQQQQQQQRTHTTPLSAPPAGAHPRAGGLQAAFSLPPVGVRAPHTTASLPPYAVLTPPSDRWLGTGASTTAAHYPPPTYAISLPQQQQPPQQQIYRQQVTTAAPASQLHPTSASALAVSTSPPVSAPELARISTDLKTLLRIPVSGA
jgi:hypothetical protein